MNQYNSYYLYQQFEKRGSQDWLPCYPNIFSVDGDGTMPLVMKKENDPDCGYTGDTQPIYRWYPLPITTDYICDECPVVQYRWENMNPSTDYYCDGTTKYYKQKRQYSYDSGTTWYDVTPPEYQQGSVYEQQSTDCGYVPPIEPQYRTTSGTPYCEDVDKYVEVYSQVSYDGGITWSTTATTVTLVERNSQDCGGSDYSSKYFTFVAREAGTFGFNSASTNTLSYSLDNGNTWVTLAKETNTPTVSTGQKIMWKSNFTPSYGSRLCHFYSSGKFDVEGNIMSLLYEDNFADKTTLPTSSSYSYLFSNTFSSNDNIINARNLVLPATVIPANCYYFMFSRCHNLLTAPDLPATTLADKCYQSMFAECTSLTAAPLLPATTLAYKCYMQMFSYCASLTTVPSNMLPATTLANYCYYEMFYYCTSLTTAPLLPATTLANYCYYGMFYDCNSLTTAPDLPATTLKEHCCERMFYSCDNINYIKCLATNRSATNCTSNWVAFISSSGTFVKAASMTSWPTGSNGIPSGWTVQDAS